MVFMICIGLNYKNQSEPGLLRHASAMYDVLPRRILLFSNFTEDKQNFNIFML